MEDVFDENDDAVREREEMVQKMADQEKTRRIDYRITFNTEAGTRVVNVLVNRFGLYSPSYVEGSEMANDAVFRDGQKSVVTYILKSFQPPGDLVDQIMREVLSNGR